MTAPDAISTYLEMAQSYADNIPLAPNLNSEEEAISFAEQCLKHASPKWLMGWRDITNSTNERTVISGALPVVAVGNKIPLMFVDIPRDQSAQMLPTCLCSLVQDFAARQKIGGTTLNFFLYRQLPVLNPANFCQVFPVSSLFSVATWMLFRTLELSYTAWNMQPWAQAIGYDGPPFRWDPKRRFLLRCELDAAFFHLYLPAAPDGDWCPARKQDGCPHDEKPEELGELKKHFPTPRDAVDYIMDTFPIVKRKDEKAHGSYRTKDTILEMYDQMAHAIATGQPYQTWLDPAPGPPTDAEGNFIPMAQWDANNWPEHIHSAMEVD